MSDYSNLYKGVSRAAWGYFFICLDININTVSVIPSFIGYILFLSAVNYLKDEERELSLLYGIGVILALWNGADWIASLVAFDLDGVWQFADILIGILSLYFHFQFFTNLASLAAKYQPEGDNSDSKFLHCRTVETLVLTALTIISYVNSHIFAVWGALATGMLIIYAVTGICLMIALFNFRRSLPA